GPCGPNAARLAAPMMSAASAIRASFQRHWPATRISGSSAAADGLIAAAATIAAPAPAARPRVPLRSVKYTLVMTSNIISESLWSAPTIHNSTSGFSPTNATARAGLWPSSSAQRHTSANTPRSAATNTDFRVQNATGTLRCASRYVARVHRGPYRLLRRYQLVRENLGSLRGPWPAPAAQGRM